MAGSALSVLITGASSGIGLGIAGVFARQGHRLMLCGIETVDSVKPTMEKLKSESKRANPIIDYVQIDLTKPNDCREIVRKTVAEFRSIDVLGRFSCFCDYFFILKIGSFSCPLPQRIYFKQFLFYKA